MEEGKEDTHLQTETRLEMKSGSYEFFNNNYGVDFDLSRFSDGADKQQVDMDFSQPFKIQRIFKQFDPETGTIQKMVEVSYPVTAKLPEEVPLNLLKKILKRSRKGINKNSREQSKENLEIWDLENSIIQNDKIIAASPPNTDIKLDQSPKNNQKQQQQLQEGEEINEKNDQISEKKDEIKETQQEEEIKEKSNELQENSNEIIKQKSNEIKEKSTESKESQIEVEEEQNEEDYVDDQNCQWTQTHKFCKILKGLRFNRIKILNRGEFDRLLCDIKQRLIVVREDRVQPRGELFLRLKHLSSPGINYIKYENKYLISFEDLVQLEITFTRLMIDNYSPRLDNQLFDSFKRANVITKFIKINPEIKIIEDNPSISFTAPTAAPNSFKFNKIQSSQIRKQQYDYEKFKKVKIEEEVDDVEGKINCSHSNSDSEHLLQKADSEKMSSIKDDSSHNIMLSKETAPDTNQIVLMNNNLENRLLDFGETSCLNHSQFTKDPSNSSNQSNYSHFEKDLYKYQYKRISNTPVIGDSIGSPSQGGVDYDKWKIEYGNDYCHQVLKNKKFLATLKHNNSSDILKSIKQFKFKSLEEFYSEHQKIYEQIHRSHHLQSIDIAQLKKKYKDKFRQCIQQLKDKFQYE